MMIMMMMMVLNAIRVSLNQCCMKKIVLCYFLCFSPLCRDIIIHKLVDSKMLPR